ncbi:hypothetical protein SDC9_131262 [bioreactor metagenome]|uniref:Uncharacterized protein n=1 Tax=bioreactor metagenome TaxID=1076179 RepID=A0A645D4Q2_9ZZZZ
MQMFLYQFAGRELQLQVLENLDALYLFQHKKEQRLNHMEVKKNEALILVR